MIPFKKKIRKKTLAILKSYDIIYLFQSNVGDFPSGQRGQTVNLLATPSVVRIHHRPLNADVAQLAEQLICNQQVIGSSPIIGFQFNNTAGWSSLEARRAHNPKVTGSNPVPAIKKARTSSLAFFFSILSHISRNHGNKPDTTEETYKLPRSFCCYPFLPGNVPPATLPVLPS